MSRPSPGVLVPLAFVLLVAACSRPVEPIRIASILSEGSTRAVRMLVDQANADGGVDGRPLELVRKDSRISGQFNAERLIVSARAVVEDPTFVGIIGPGDSDSALLLGPTFARGGLPTLTTIATNPAVTRSGSTTWRLCISDAIQGAELARHASRHGLSRVAIFHVADDYGRGLSDEFERAIAESDGEIIARVSLRTPVEAPERELIGAVLDRLETEGWPDLFALFVRIGVSRTVIDEIRSRRPDSRILGGDNVGPYDLPKDAEGFVHRASFVEPDPTDPITRDFQVDYTTTFGETPTYSEAFAYEGTRLLLQVLRRVGADRHAVQAELDRMAREGEPIDGVGGRYHLDPRREAHRTFWIVEDRGGRTETVSTIEPDGST